ncbi:MAG: TonB-dependent receptor [Parvularcula sp.]|jgi:outer membrane receptor protein involved in Fe transport|nr:TonB-dependent receptor [Parvularcula sp.]
MKRFNKGTLLAGTIMAGAVMAAPAHAQVNDDVGPALQSGADENTDLDNAIVVTGSRIARRNVDTAAPVAVVDAEEFQLTGAVNIENVLNALPQVVPGTTSFSNNPGNGAATLDLRGLGTTRTLVLVNGRRWTFFDVDQVVDLNTIPQFMLESIDTVTGGASAVYGSDALAGVVNFRLREVQGVELNSQYSLTERGDGSRFQISGAIGSDFADGRGNVTVYGEYFDREEIFQGDRAFSEFVLAGEGDTRFTPGGSSLPPETRLTYLGNGDNTGTAFETNGNLAIFDPAGSIRDYRTPQDLYNYAPINYLQIPQERYLLGGNASYEVNESLEVYGEVSYVNNRVATELAPTPILINTFLDIDQLEGDGFIDEATAAQFRQLDASEEGDEFDDGLINVQVRRRLVEAGGRNNLDERNAFRIVSGARGSITDYLSYDAYYLFARTRNANIQQGNASLSRFTAGVNGTADNPINIFGANTLTPDMVDSFRIQAQNGDISTLQVMTGALSGTFGDFALGAAEPIGFAAGVERRIVSAQFLPDEFLASGDVAGFNAGEATDGGYDVNEAFAELIIPFETEGGFRVELNGAARYSDYSLDAVGGVWTYAGGVQIQPIPDITLRGQYQRAVRAPNVGELFGGFANNFPAATDPCATVAATSGGLRSVCAANGVPGDLLDDLGSGDSGVVSAAQALIQPDPQIATSIGGNPNLFEETSDSFTVGAVLEPRFLPGLTVTADYFDISIEDAIITLAFQDSLNLCFNEAQDLSDPRCAPFRGTRDASGAFGRAQLPLQGDANIGELSTSGIDLVVNYNTDLGFSLFSDDIARLDLNFLGTWTDTNDLRPDPTDPTVVTRCAGFFGLTCGNPQPTFKWVTRASYIDGPMTISTRWRHLSGTEDDANPDGGLGQFIDAYDLIDLTFRFDASEQITITAGVNNLFDTLPDTPVFVDGEVVNDTNSILVGDSNSEQANTFPSTFDVLGRDYFVGVQFRF